MPHLLQLHRGRAAIVTEMYLPQKYAKAPIFLQALEDSLKPEKVRAHFENSNTAHHEKIKRQLLEVQAKRYEELKDRVLDKKRTFGGYSSYDVMGAFKDSPPKGQGTAPTKAIYDACSCVRIIDHPDSRDLLKRPNSKLAQVLEPDQHPLFQAVCRTIFALRQHHDLGWPNVDKILAAKWVGSPRCRAAVEEIQDYLENWIEEGSFLLYGFLGYHLCEAGADEEEIWLTSHFTVVNPYKRENREANAGSRLSAFGAVLGVVVGGAAGLWVLDALRRR